MSSQARLAAIAAAVLFSTGGAAIKVAAFTAPQVSAMRSGIAAAALLLLVRGRIARSKAALGIGIVYAATLTLFVASTKLTTSANAIFLQSTAPLYLLPLSPLILREPVTRRDLVYVGAVAIGMVCCFLGQPEATVTAPDPATGNLLGVACGLAWALTLLALRWAERGHDHRALGLTAVIAGNALACAIALPFALPLPNAPVAAWATMLYLGVFQIGLAYVALTAAMRHLPALDASLLLLLEPVLNPVWTWLARGERPGGWTIAGGAVIIVAAGAKAVADARATTLSAATKGTRTV
jgi:drug/metabolite transporter (DMT)-like permease